MSRLAASQTNRHNRCVSGLGWAELPWTVVAEKLESGEMVRLNYSFQQSDILHGVDVIWTERRALGSGGQWLMQKLLALDPDLWSKTKR